MDDSQAQLVDKLKTATNVLVTVSRDPSIDQLASCIALTLLLNKQGKHAAAIFSGQIPSTLEFLQPEVTLEKTVDSLRDFIISLDKTKADKLRYKVEDNVVRIFITPYKTSLSEADLTFTQGEFNVDLVVALGVHNQEELDEAIMAHGRILHDAAIASINILENDGNLGTINWQDSQASSLCEMVAGLPNLLGNEQELLDAQIATSLLTGIIAETQRFSNPKTSSQTMSISAALMSAGANQQLVVSKLEETAPKAKSASASQAGNAAADKDDGLIEISHQEKEDKGKPKGKAAKTKDKPANTKAEGPDTQQSAPGNDLLASDATEISVLPAETVNKTSNLTAGSKFITEPPSLGGMLTANSEREKLDPSVDPLHPPSPPEHLLQRKRGSSPLSVGAAPPAASAMDVPATTPPLDTSTLSLQELENTVAAPPPPPPPPAPLQGLEDLNGVRDEVAQALNDQPATDTSMISPPIQPLSDQPPAGFPPIVPTPADPFAPLPPAPLSDTPYPFLPSEDAQSSDPNAPPPVPPPIPFQFGNPNAPQ